MDIKRMNMQTVLPCKFKKREEKKKIIDAKFVAHKYCWFYSYNYDDGILK